MSDPKASLTYAQSGVDIDAGNALVDRIKPAAKRTMRPGVSGGLGGFGALFDLKAAGLVAMCVNDLICQGAEPLFFLDYFATGKLDIDAAEVIISGIAEGCSRSGCALIGGETAEMPGMYAAEDFDLAGFAVGAMERGATLPRNVSKGDVLIGMMSDGPHSNGYSLIRKIVEREGLNWSDPAPFSNDTVGRALLAPTRLYVKPALKLLELDGLHGLAHITGGGLSENLPRVFPKGVSAEVDLGAWTVPPALHWLIEKANMSEAEALKTFNCGLGMIAVVAADQAEEALRSLSASGEVAMVIGSLVEGGGDVAYTGSLL